MKTDNIFPICVTAVVVTFIICVTIYNLNLSAKNDPHLACIAAKGTYYFGRCTFQ